MNARVRGLFPFKGEDARDDSSISKRNESDLHSISIPKRGSLARWKPPPESFRVSPLQWTKITLSLSLSLSLPCNFLPSLLSPRKEPLVRISHARHEMRTGCIGYLNDDLWLLICTIRATVRLYRKSAAVTASSVSLSLSLSSSLQASLHSRGFRHDLNIVEAVALEPVRSSLLSSLVALFGTWSIRRHYHNNW